MRFGLELLLAMGAGAVLAAAVARADLPVEHALELGAVRQASAAAPSPVVVTPSRKWASRLLDRPFLERYAITLRHLHTDEILPIPVDGITAGPDLDRFLRCRVTGDRAHMNPLPVSVAVAMAVKYGAAEIQVVSGYRSVRFNEMLRKKGHQVARASQHPLGQALDFRIPDVPSSRLAREIAEFHEGGVGVYRRSGFVHVDAGPKREWRGR